MTEANPPWSARVLTLFPELYPGPLGVSIVGRALENRLWTLDVVDIRDYALDKHRSVDDTPAGGGPGMVMRVDVLARALDSVLADNPVAKAQPIVYFSPRGPKLDQAMLRRFVADRGVTLICGRFEGVDERIFIRRPVIEVSLGDFILAGGDVAAFALIEGAARLLPNVAGNAASIEEESFADGLLEYPQYTRPQEWEGLAIPSPLISGHHKMIQDWRQAQSEAVTRERRPDLWAKFTQARGKRDPKK